MAIELKLYLSVVVRHNVQSGCEIACVGFCDSMNELYTLSNNHHYNLFENISTSKPVIVTKEFIEFYNHNKDNILWLRVNELKN